MAWVIVIGNYKGGVGKTTFATTLAVWLAKKNNKVMGVDVCPSGAFKAWADKRRENTAIAAFKNEPPIEVEHLTATTEFEGADAVIADGDLLLETINRLEDSEAETGLRAIIIDAPGFGTNFAMRAHVLADMIVTPVDVRDPRGVEMLLGQYGEDLAYWKSKRPREMAPARHWVVPNLVERHGGRRVILPFQASLISKLKQLGPDMGFDVTPPLDNEPAHWPARQDGFSILDTDAGWLEEQVGEFNRTSAEKILNECFGCVLAPTFVPTRAA